jgi:hypothetical protein
MREDSDWPARPPRDDNLGEMRDFVFHLFNQGLSPKAALDRLKRARDRGAAPRATRAWPEGAWKRLDGMTRRRDED